MNPGQDIQKPEFVTQGNNLSSLHRWSKMLCLVLVVVFTPLMEAIWLISLNSDSWMDLRVGMWMLQNHSIPRTGIFSQYPSLPWIDVNWAYQLLVALFFQCFGLRAVPLMALLVSAFMVAALLACWRSLGVNFWPALAITAVPTYLLHLMPISCKLSAALFALEILLWDRFRRRHENRDIVLLAVLLLAWANLDASFLYGVAFLGLFAVISALQFAVKGIHEESAAAYVGRNFLFAAAGLMGAILSPGLFSTWNEAWTDLFSASVIKHSFLLQPMNFRTPAHYVALFFVMGCCMVLGYRRLRDPLILLALVAALMVGFRFPRDLWLPLVCAAVAVGIALRGNQQDIQESHASWPLSASMMQAAAACLVVIAVAATTIPSSLPLLAQRARVQLPIAACDAIRSQHLPQPIFQSYEWGGFMAWYMPEVPVVMDSRIGLYGNERTASYFGVLEGSVLVSQDMGAASAQTFLLIRRSNLARAMQDIPALSDRFKVAYQDSTAIVFIRR